MLIAPLVRKSQLADISGNFELNYTLVYYSYLDYINAIKRENWMLLNGWSKGTVAPDAISLVKTSRTKLIQFAENYRPAYFGIFINNDRVYFIH